MKLTCQDLFLYPKTVIWQYHWVPNAEGEDEFSLCECCLDPNSNQSDSRIIILNKTTKKISIQTDSTLNDNYSGTQEGAALLGIDTLSHLIVHNTEQNARWLRIINQIVAATQRT